MIMKFKGTQTNVVRVVKTTRSIQMSRSNLKSRDLLREHVSLQEFGTTDRI